MSNFFGIYKGRKIGVFVTWAQTKMLVQGYQGAIFKKFKTFAQAEHFSETGLVLCIETSFCTNIVDCGELYLYTDGSFSTKTLRSGIGVAFDEEFSEYNQSKRLEQSTKNQQSELCAMLLALKMIDKILAIKFLVVERNAIIWTDSDYVCKCLSDYIFKWKENGWMTSNNTSVKHQSLIENCYDLKQKLRCVTIRHITEVGITAHTSKQSICNAPELTQRVWKGNFEADKLAKGK